MKIKLIVFTLLISGTFPSLAQVKDKDLLSQLTDSVKHPAFDKVHSILITKGNNLVYEQYFNGYGKDSLHDTRSSFKSVASLLMGIAIDKGFIKSTAQQMLDFFPEYPALKNDSLKKEVTIQQLLDMRAGFDCEEFNGTKDCEEQMELNRDWVKYSLEVPMKHPAGTVWSYTSIEPVIIGGIIRKATKMSVMDFAKKYLFDPLQISNYKWTLDSAGNPNTAGSFFIRPIDMIKIGQMVRDQGKWKGKQVISKEWIEKSTLCSIPIPDFSNMKFSKSKMGIPQPTFYGSYWYREKLKTKNLEEEVLFASGNGGQFMFISKKLDLVILFNQGYYGNAKAKRAFDLMVQYILPAFKAKTK
jgi:CubicO group peptidase (beta-lactamase class C family)